MTIRALLTIGLVTLLGSIGLLKLISAVHMMPEAASSEAAFVDQAFDGMMKLTIPIFCLVVVTLMYCLLRFRARGPAEEGLRFWQSRGHFVEVVWILTSLVLTLGLAAFGSKEFLLIRGGPHAELDVQVTASQWSWEFFYPHYNQYSPELLLPKGQRVRLLLTSEDVVHSFWVPEFRVKQDALPGRVVKLLLTPTKIGQYTAFCAELCGKEHTIMNARVQVMEPEAFATKMQETW